MIPFYLIDTALPIFGAMLAIAMGLALVLAARNDPARLWIVAGTLVGLGLLTSRDFGDGGIPLYPFSCPTPCRHGYIVDGVAFAVAATLSAAALHVTARHGLSIPRRLLIASAAAWPAIHIGMSWWIA